MTGTGSALDAKKRCKCQATRREQRCFIVGSKGKSFSRGLFHNHENNVHLAIRSSCVSVRHLPKQMLTEKNTLDLTESMQYGLRSIKQWINFYIKLSSGVHQDQISEALCLKHNPTERNHFFWVFYDLILNELSESSLYYVLVSVNRDQEKSMAIYCTQRAT